MATSEPGRLEKERDWIWWGLKTSPQSKSNVTKSLPCRIPAKLTVLLGAFIGQPLKSTASWEMSTPGELCTLQGKMRPHCSRTCQSVSLKSISSGEVTEHCIVAESHSHLPLGKALRPVTGLRRSCPTAPTASWWLQPNWGFVRIPTPSQGKKSVTWENTYTVEWFPLNDIHSFVFR